MAFADTYIGCFAVVGFTRLRWLMDEGRWKNWLPPPPTSFRSERLAASLAVGDGDDFLYPSSPPLLTASFVRGAALMLERLMILRWLVKAELTFQVVKHRGRCR
jgi:hypothetical protein